jgi:CRP-like cAMP-binding protein
MDSRAIIAHFSKHLPLNDLEVEALVAKLTERKIKRRQYILQQKDVCKHYTYVVNGCFKMYKVDVNGQEHNLQFAIDDGWIADIGSFHSGKPSELYIEAIEQSTILQIEKPNLLSLYTNHPKFDRIFRVLIENAFVSLQKRVLQNISSTAEERYLDFLKIYPSLFNRISNVQIASYIGVTPEFLSKIRKNIATR